MKAACVLVCLALAHGITGSIFKQQERKVDGLDVQQLEYNDQYQELHRDQATEGQKQRNQMRKSQKNRGRQHQNQKYMNQQVQDQIYQGQEQLQNQKYRNQQVQDQTYQGQEQLQNQKYSSQQAQDQTYQGQEQPQNQKYRNQQAQDQIYQGQQQLQNQKYNSQQAQDQTYQGQEQQQNQKYRNQQAQDQTYQGQEQLQNQKYRNQQAQDQTYQGQEQQQNQKYRNQQAQDQTYQGQEQLQNQKYSSQEAQDQTYQSQEQLQNQKYSSQEAQDQTYQSQDQQTQASQNQQQLNHEQYQQSAFLNSQEWPANNQHSHHSHHQHDKNHRHYPSSESSQESKESKYYGNQQLPLGGDNQMWNSPLFNSVMNKDNPNFQAYGDVIEWNGLRMAVGPNSPVQTPEDIEKIFGDAQKAMRHIQEEEKVKYHEVYEVAKQEDNEDAQLNATQLAQKYQYLIEEHAVKTEDGYILTVFRIPPKKQFRDVQKNPVVFLMHGILGSADDWLLMGPGKSLAYLLSDAGYDVWLGNARGNKYSRRHVTKYPAMADFWQFSTDEIALHDLPAMIDFALETTKQEKLYYIGHALGTTAFFALAATRPEYNNKIIMMYALSPMVYMTNVRSPLFRMIAPTSKFQERLSRQIRNEAFTPSKELIQTLGGAMCENEIGCKKVCSNVNFVMAGVNVDGMDSNIIPVVMEHLPAGTSAKVIKQYGQGVASHEFRRYNYGPYINEKVYGTLEAPKFNIAEVQAPVTLYYSEEDWLAHPKDVLRLQKELPNVSETYKVPEEHFSHMDFQFSSKAPEMVYQRIIESMQNQQ